MVKSVSVNKGDFSLFCPYEHCINKGTVVLERAYCTVLLKLKIEEPDTTDTDCEELHVNYL